jgi:hypothetical protein
LSASVSKFTLRHRLLGLLGLLTTECCLSFNALLLAQVERWRQDEVIQNLLVAFRIGSAVFECPEVHMTIICTSDGVLQAEHVYFKELVVELLVAIFDS